MCVCLCLFLCMCVCCVCVCLCICLMFDFNDIKKGLEGRAQGFRRCRSEQSLSPNYRPDSPLPSTCSFSTRSCARKRAISDPLSLRVVLSLSLSESISNQISNLGCQELSVLYAHTRMCTCTHTHTQALLSFFLSLAHTHASVWVVVLNLE